MLSISNIEDAAKIVAKEYPIEKIQLFGSYAENKNTAQSDVDILVEFSQGAVITLLTLCGLKNRMEELLNTSVDVISLPLPDDSMLKINKVVQIYAA